MILPMSGTKQAKLSLRRHQSSLPKLFMRNNAALANKSRKSLSLENVILKELKMGSSHDVLSAAEKDKEPMQNERKSLNTFLTDEP